jgi:hypothetical protein
VVRLTAAIHGSGDDARTPALPGYGRVSHFHCGATPVDKSAQLIRAEPAAGGAVEPDRGSINPTPRLPDPAKTHRQSKKTA